MYFETINIANLVRCILMRCFGRKVYYFEVGRGLGKVPYLKYIPSKFLEKIQYYIGESEGLCFDIHNRAIISATELHRLLIQDHSSSILNWAEQFGSNKVHIYTKKLLALKSFDVIKKYLILVELAKHKNVLVTYHVDYSPINQALIPKLSLEFESELIQLKGLKPSYFKHAWYSFSQLGELFIHLTLASIGRRIRFNINTSSYKISKEILWEIGTSRRNDDFFVDEDKIKIEDVLLYYRNSSKRRIRQGYLEKSIQNATQQGYNCINFDKTDLSLGTIFHIVLRKYFIFAFIIALVNIIKPKLHSNNLLLQQALFNFLGQSIRWDIFLTSYLPTINLSQEDPYPSHISDTIILNSHGCKNAGFQWADDTQWRAVTLAFVAYDIYFAWGPLAKNYWTDNWEVDSVIATGYLWGHHVKESLPNRDALRKKHITRYHPEVSIIALLDERITPDLPTSKKMLYDFYSLGVELIKRRDDIRIVAKPKRWSHNESGVPEIDDLLSPYIQDGSFTLIGRENIDVQQVIALADVMVSMGMGVPYLEAMCCGTIGFNFAPAHHTDSPLYKKGYGTIVFDDINLLADAIESAIDHPNDYKNEEIESIIKDVDPFRDLRGIDRFREALVEIV